MKTSADSPIEVHFVAGSAHGLPGRLGLTLAPGKCDGEKWKRDLAEDVRRLREDYGTDVIVSLLETMELKRLSIGAMPQAVRDAGMDMLRLPIPDGDVPASVEECQPVVRRMITELADGRTVVVHCRGGLGRSGLVAACVLTSLGHDAEAAIAIVRDARPGAVENEKQERFVARFADAEKAPG
jgi:protein-tyrosine phosphatase